MSVSLYKPNSKNSGAVFTFKFGPSQRGGSLKEEISLYVSTIKQATWDATTKKGTFKDNAKNPEKTLNIKLSEFEVGGIINAVKQGVEFKGYHTIPGRAGHVQFSFTPSSRDNVVLGFFFSILRDGKDRFSIPISMGECETLIAYLDFGLKTLFSNRFKATQNYSSKRQERSQAPSQSEQESQGPNFEGNPFEEQVVVEEQEQEDENPFG